MLDIAIEAIGWVGAVLVVLAYLLISTGRLTPASPAYQGLNAAGGFALVVNCVWNGALPSAVTNVIWLGIALFALLRIARVPRPHRPSSRT